MKEPKVDTWIKAGYKLLGTEGLEGIKVERLARKLNLNKSGFYYYFGSMKHYVKSLLGYHVRLAIGIAEEVETCDGIDPDFLHLVVKHKAFFLVESQLLVKCKPKHAHENLDEAGKIISKEFLPLWRRESELPEDSSVAMAYMNILRLFFYARINSENISYQFLHKLVVETRDVLDKVAEEKMHS